MPMLSELGREGMLGASCPVASRVKPDDVIAGPLGRDRTGQDLLHRLGGKLRLAGPGLAGNHQIVMEFAHCSLQLPKQRIAVLAPRLSQPRPPSQYFTSASSTAATWRRSVAGLSCDTREDPCLTRTRSR